MSTSSPEQFFHQPILNSPYEYPTRHWELDEDGQPTNQIVNTRRRAKFITPIPKPKKRRQSQGIQKELVLFSEDGVSTESQQYDPNPIINSIREQVADWRQLQASDWRVTPETARLLQHWRSHPFQSIRPFFCQVEAVETAIWLAEVAPKLGKIGQQYLDHIESANTETNPALLRVALKLPTGAGKTTVMVMLIAWQTVNAVRHPQSKRFTRGFLLVTPGITIRDRLRVLQPNDPDSYYASRELVPNEMLADIARAKIVIVNYHAFKLREKVDISKVGRSLLKGRGEDLQTWETERQMLQRVMPELMGMKKIAVINDEAHHCYREKPLNRDLEDLQGDEKDEAKKNNEAARLWISGLEIVKRKLGVEMVYDLSATPFFLRGSGYAEGTLPVVAPPKPPRETVQVKAIKPDLDRLEIQFPRVEGYRVELPEERLTAKFSQDSVLELTPMLVGSSVTHNQGILGEVVELNVKHLDDMRQSTILFHLTKHLLYTRYRDSGEEPKLHLFGQLKRIVRQWLDGGYLQCKGGTSPTQLLYQEIANMACDRIKTAIDEVQVGDRPIVKNHNLGLEVPYLHGSTPRKYLPDFIVQIDDGRADLLNLIVEIKGYRGEDAKEKASAIRTYWIAGVNNLGTYGRWEFAEFTAVFEIESEFNQVVEHFTQPICI